MKGSKSTKDRMREFATYHRTGDGECNGILMKAYADKHKMDTQERYDFAYFYAATYYIPSAIIMLRDRKEIKEAPRVWSAKHKGQLIFQSDRRYARLKDNFEKMLTEYASSYQNADGYIKRNVHGKTVDLKKALQKTREKQDYPPNEQE